MRHHDAMNLNTYQFKQAQAAIAMDAVKALADDTVTEFAWHDVFYAGEHVDMHGNKNAFSRDDLKQIVDNFKPQQAPLVIGHPELNAPAFGWVSDIRLTDDNRLEIKAANVNVEFAKAVAAKAFPNRSIKILKTKQGWELAHVGYLGAAPPALAGMPWQFSQDNDAALVCEYSINPTDPKKENHVEKFTQEQLDAAVQKAVSAAVAEATSEFASQTAALNKRAEEAEALLEQAQLEQEKLAFAATVKAQQAAVDELVKTGCLLPAQANGLAEFMAHLSTLEQAEFSFAQGEKEVKEQPFAFASRFLMSLKQPKSPLGDDPEFKPANHDDLDARASAYAEKHNVSYGEAVLAVSGE